MLTDMWGHTCFRPGSVSCHGLRDGDAWDVPHPPALVLCRAKGAQVGCHVLQWPQMGLSRPVAEYSTLLEKTL